jgi:hypothetical protein
MASISRFNPFYPARQLHKFQLETCGEVLECLIDTFIQFDIQIYITDHIESKEDVDKELHRIQHVLKTMEGPKMLPYRMEYPQKHRAAVIRLNKLFKGLLWVRDQYPQTFLPQGFFYEKNSF